MENRLATVDAGGNLGGPGGRRCLEESSVGDEVLGGGLGWKGIQMFKLVLEKAEEPEIKLPTSAGSWKKQESSRKTSISALLAMPKPLTV